MMVIFSHVVGIHERNRNDQLDLFPQIPIQTFEVNICCKSLLIIYTEVLISLFFIWIEGEKILKGAHLLSYPISNLINPFTKNQVIIMERINFSFAFPFWSVYRMRYCLIPSLLFEMLSNSARSPSISTLTFF
jgi:hypothetical protein